MSIDPAVPGSEQPSDAKMEFIDVGLKEAGRRDSSPTRDGASNAENNDVEPDSSMNRTKWLACLAMAICYTTYFQQHACVASIVKHIDDKLGPTTYYNWILTGHNITVSLALPLVGGLSDIFGRKWFCMSGCVITLIGTTIALASQNIPMVIAALTLKGFGTAAQHIAIVAVAEIVPNKHRGTTQAIMDLVSLPWTVFGGMIGNSMVKHYALSFRVNWIIGVILNSITIVMIYFFYHPPGGTLPPGTSKLKAFCALDWAGIAFYGLGMTLTLVGIAFGGDVFPWKSAGVIVTMGIGVLFLIALGLWEWKGASNPFFAHEMFRGQSSRFHILLGLSFVGGMSSYSASAFWPQQSQAMFFSDPDKIGYSTLPMGIAGAVGGCIVGFVIGKYRYTQAKYMLFFGVLLKLCGDLMFSFVTPHRLALALTAGFVGQLGMGFVFIGLIVATQLTCQDSHLGLASLVTASVRTMGGSVSITIYSSILQNTLKKEVGPRVAKAIAATGVPLSSVGASLPMLIKLLMGSRQADAAKLPGVTPTVLEAASMGLKWAWSVSFRGIYYAGIAFTCVAFMLCFFMPDVSQFMTDNVACKLTNDTPRRDEKMEA